MAFLRERSDQSIPAVGNQWQEKTLYATRCGRLCYHEQTFHRGDWMIEVYQGTAPISKTIYQITVFNALLGCYWKGNIKADGSIQEVSPMTTLSKEKTLKLAEGLSKRINVPPPKPGG